ncbi:hypothetical protein QVD17_11994 [Tagetes erecta]|uniref:Uncharacterized protein n=1 Tax=Tagetes erecta TaxID=13708 RepID=A0AAD8KZ15_TARER|nr:hypothetical protein QVD17_11994 [Tagetes erecta]
MNRVSFGANVILRSSTLLENTSTVVVVIFAVSAVLTLLDACLISHAVGISGCRCFLPTVAIKSCSVMIFF